MSGGFYSNWFDGTIKLSNETWHIEPTRKYGLDLARLGPSIIYNALDVDMAKYNSSNAFRSKRDVIDEESSSFCGLDKSKQREKMRAETERKYEDNDADDDNLKFKSRYTRSKRQTGHGEERERTCCYIYIRVDPTLWDVVYKNEGLNVSICRACRTNLDLIRPSLGKGAHHSCHCHISLSNGDRRQRHLSVTQVRIQRRCVLSIHIEN